MLGDALAASVTDAENINRFAFHFEYHTVNMWSSTVKQVTYLKGKVLVFGGQWTAAGKNGERGDGFL
jgi:hypothetical protein